MARITISLRDWVVKTYLQTTGENKSRYIEELIILGAETKLKSEDNLKARILEVIQELDALRVMNSELRERLKNKTREKKEKARQDNPDFDSGECVECINCHRPVNIKRGTEKKTYFLYRAGAVCFTCEKQEPQKKKAEWAEEEEV